MCGIATAVGIPSNRVQGTLHQQFNMKKTPHCIPKMRSSGMFEGQFDAVSVETIVVSSSFCHSRQNMDVLLHAQDQTSVQTIGYYRRVCTKKVETVSS